MSLSIDQITEACAVQAKSTEFWIGEYKKYNDVSSKTNAALAIGRYFGMCDMLYKACTAQGKEVPAQHNELVNKFNNVWANL